MNRIVPEDLKPIAKKLELVINRGHSPAQVFRDWVEIMLYAFLRDDERYLELLQTYTKCGMQPGEIQTVFAQALGELLLSMRSTGKERLGELFTVYAANPQLGQFLTPFPLCAVMADATDTGDKEGSVLDCASGSGSLLIALGARRSPAANERSLYIGQDMDRCCSMMTALNLLWFNLNGIAIWGNALNAEVREAWEIRASIRGGTIRVFPRERYSELLASVRVCGAA